MDEQNDKKYKPMREIIAGLKYDPKKFPRATQELMDYAVKRGVPTILIDRARKLAIRSGELLENPDQIREAYTEILGILSQKGREENEDYLGIFERETDPKLKAAFLVNLIPEIEKKFGEDSNIYRIVLNIPRKRREQGEDGKRIREEYGEVQEKSREDNPHPSLISYDLERLIKAFPPEVFNERTERARRASVLLRKKAEKETLRAFERSSDEAFSIIEQVLNASDTHPNIRRVYQQFKETYQKYIQFKLEDVNPNFEDPETGKKGVLPSVHQVIADYHILEQQRFGVFDGCGTGKTAIAVLAQPLIKKALGGKCKTIICCPNSAKDVWKKALLGDEKKRYLKDAQNAVVLNGNAKDPNVLSADVKDQNFINELQTKDWVIINYEQLQTLVKDKIKINGKEVESQEFSECLGKMGFDYVIFDEAHHLKKHDELTSNDTLTLSGAARRLAFNAKYLVLLSGTPIPDRLEDYAIPFHLLKPGMCDSPEKFIDLYRENPRILYTLVHENSIRRTSREINDLKSEPIDDRDIELDSIQRKIYEHIVDKRPCSDWLNQARYALLDPRLVNPAILKELGLIGKVSIANSAKYKKLEQILTDEDGPIAKGEKFVVFSRFKEGVTRDSEGLKQKYVKLLGSDEEYNKLELDKTLAQYLENKLKESGKTAKIAVIDGEVKNEERPGIIDGLKDGLSGIICTTETVGESLDLSAASYAIFLEDDYSPMTNEQALSRLLRKGQKRNRIVKDICLRAKNTLDEILADDYVKKKKLLITMATDGYALTEAEREFIDDNKQTALKDLIKRKFGGVSINTLEADELMNDTGVFCTKINQKKRKSSKNNSFEINYETTDAQRIREWIARDSECWKNPEFVELYVKTFPNLCIPVMDRARICDLVRRADTKEIDFPKMVIAEASAHSILYQAYQDLKPLIEARGYKLPEIVDRDTSFPFLKAGKNPNRVVGCMTGRNSMFKDESFDMVDNGSLHLLNNSNEVKKSLLEAHRILKTNGLLELALKNKRFVEGFREGLEKLGFEVLTEKNEGFAISKDFSKRLRREKGQHFAGAYEDKLADSQVILARKVREPAEVPAEQFWFEVDESIKQESDYEENESEVDRENITPRKRKTRMMQAKKEKQQVRILPNDIPGYSGPKDAIITEEV